MVLLGPVGGLVINGVVSIIIWEALVEDILEGFVSSEGIGDVSSGGLWDSLNHDGKGDVVVVGDILGLISGSLKDGVEGVVANNLSEGLEGNGFDSIEGISGGNSEVDSLDLINWDINESWVISGDLVVNLDEVGGWDLGNEFWSRSVGLDGSIFVMVLVLVVLLVVALML